MVLDHDLRIVARHRLSDQLVDIKKTTTNNQTFLYVKEEQNNLEVFTLAPLKNQPDQLTLTGIKAFEVQGQFDWFNDTTLIITLPGKLQFLDIANLNEINEIAAKIKVENLPVVPLSEDETLLKQIEIGLNK